MVHNSSLNGGATVVPHQDDHAGVKQAVMFGSARLRLWSTATDWRASEPQLLYHFDQMFRWRVTEGRELNIFGLGDGDGSILWPN
jgi:hypothetical protein